ncbi:MAG: fatty acid desaturase [Planctomycetes bacterium]|nr:fatty acid desaturase [Planctomycetota bacterium]
MREPKQLLIASKQYAKEFRWQSWWQLGSTLVVSAIAVAVACSGLPFIVRIPAGIVMGLLLVRLFVLYHDYQHGAIFRRSPVVAGLMYLYGIIALTPPSIWNRSHDHHHKNNSNFFGGDVGSYPLMTVEDYAKASPKERFCYAASRHPLNIGLGYLTIFLGGMCLRPLLINPRRHIDCALALAVHLTLVVWLAIVAWQVLLVAVILPFTVACGLGAYLFYAQHNFPGLELRNRAEWNHAFAALHSSSYIQMNGFMRWCTGNIGYHHVHHFNARIPFYRLPEAMAGMEELQAPCTTSLSLRDIVGCLRLKLWDPEKNRLVNFNGV